MTQNWQEVRTKDKPYKKKLNELGEQRKDDFYYEELEARSQNNDTTPARGNIKKPRNSQAEFSEVNWERI